MKSFAPQIALIFFVLSVFLLGCHKQSTTIHNKLTGTWLYETNYSSGGKFKSVVTVGTNGIYFGHITTVGRSNLFREFDLEGTWQIQDGFLIDTLTKHTAETNRNLHSVFRARIIQFSDQELVAEYEGNNGDLNNGLVAVFRKIKN